MRISEVVEGTGLESLNAWEDADVSGVYISDMVSDIITGAQSGCVLVTLQTHKSLIAAANLVDAALVVVTHGKRPGDDVVQLADKAGIALFSSPVDTWRYAVQLFELGLR
jgi:predicted transcriptional regulator